MSFFTVSKAFRPAVESRRLFSLRSRRHPNNRGTLNRRAPPPGIPDNATRASNELLRPNIEPPDLSHGSLSTPVYFPEDPSAVITERHPAARLLENSALIVQRKLELGNILLGFEQANKYVIMDPAGNHVGFIAEEENSFTKLLMRQWARTHRSFRTHVFDKHGVEVLKFHRPFSFINSRITVYDPVDPKSPTHSPKYVPEGKYRTIGECQQQWHMLRRKYNLFVYNKGSSGSFKPDRQPVIGERDGLYVQFAYVDEPFLSWDFSLLSDDQPPRLVGSVNRNFAGFGREMFTDTGVYALRMDASIDVEPQHRVLNTHQHDYRNSPPTLTQELQRVDGVTTLRGMTLDARAVMLATAVSIDFDYFSRHSSIGHEGIMPFGVLGDEHNASRSSEGGAGLDTAMGVGTVGQQTGQPGDHHQQQGGQYQQPRQPEEYSQPQGDSWPSKSNQQQSSFPSSGQESQNDGDNPWWFFDDDD